MQYASIGRSSTALLGNNYIYGPIKQVKSHCCTFYTCGRNHWFKKTDNSNWIKESLFFHKFQIKKSIVMIKHSGCTVLQSTSLPAQNTLLFPSCQPNRVVQHRCNTCLFEEEEELWILKPSSMRFSHKSTTSIELACKSRFRFFLACKLDRAAVVRRGFIDALTAVHTVQWKLSQSNTLRPLISLDLSVPANVSPEALHFKPHR